MLTNLTYGSLSTRAAHAGILASVLFFGSPPNLGDSKRPLTECERVAAWVSANRAHLPTDLAGLSTYSRSYRQGIFRALPPTVKAELWREQLEAYAADGTLTQAQRKYIANLVPELGELMTERLTKEQTTQYETRILGLFDRRLASRVFANLGTPSPLLESATSSTCGCNQSSAFSCTTITGPDEECAAVTCDSTSWGCGFLWLWSCDGQCRAKE